MSLTENMTMSENATMANSELLRLCDDVERSAWHYGIPDSKLASVLAVARESVALREENARLRLALSVDLGRADRDALYRHDLKALVADDGADGCHTDIGTALRADVTRLREATDSAVRAEREACAVTCEILAAIYSHPSIATAEDAATACAARIRARESRDATETPAKP
jgi:hypothetical protein